jgi:predicted dehydrogenase
MHALGLIANRPRFELVAACDRDPTRLASVADELGIARRYADADRMLAAESPDVLCFATPPAIRLELVELGIAHGVRAIALEKPLALSLAEAARIVERCAGAGVRGVVCHQLRHGEPWRRAKAIVTTGGIGEIRSVLATGRPSMLRVGTHLVDGLLWLAGATRARWVIGHAVGVNAYEEDHPCPDHLDGVLELDTGALATLHVGTRAPRHLSEEQFWGDVAVTVLGAEGYVRVVLGAGWEAATRAGGRIESGSADPCPREPQHLALLADWLDDPARPHPADLTRSYHGLEILLGMALSSLERRRVDLPIAPAPAGILERLRDALPQEAAAP